MICKNCGAELPEGTLICSRCGARQSAVGGNGGSGNGGGKKSSGGSSGGRNLVKILAAVLGVCVVVGGIIFGITRSNLNNQKDQFTHNIEFDKSNLLVEDEKTLRYRDVPNNQIFNVGSELGYVDVTILDNDNQKVDFNITRSEKNERYIIAPKTIWDNTRIYHMSLGDNTYFTDEDMHQFKNLVFSIKREYVAEYRMNEKIIELTDANKKEVKEGDVVHYIDDNGNESYGKVALNQNGNIIYGEPTLADLFESLDVNQICYPDYSAIKSDENIKKQIMYDFKKSEVFKNLVKMVYADALEENDNSIEAFASSKIDNLEMKLSKLPIDDLCELDIKMAVETDSKNYFSDIDSDSEETESLKLTIELTMNPYKGKLLKLKVPDDVSLTITISKTFAIAVKPNIHFDIFDIPHTTFDFQLFDYSKDEYEIELALETKYKYKDPNKSKEEKEGPVGSLKAKITDLDYVDDLNVDFMKDDTFITIKNNTEKLLETQKLMVLIPQAPIPIGIPVINLAVDINLNMGFEGSVKADVKVEFESKEKYGIELDEKHQLKYSKVILKSGDATIDFTGEAKFKVGINPNVHILIGLAGCYPVDMCGGFEVGGYSKIKGNVHLGENGKVINNASFETKYNDDEFSLEADINIGLDINAEVSAEYSYEIGLYANAFVEGKVNVITINILDARYYFVNAEFPFIQGGGYALASTDKGATISNATAIDVGEVGSIMRFGKYQFKVLEKDTNNGIALLVATEGIDCKEYNEKKENDNINTSHTWADSNLRAYLNKEFINNFNTIEKNALYMQKIKAEGNKKYNIKGGADSNDKIFILSQSELEKYFKSDLDRQLKASEYAVSHKAYVCDSTDEVLHKVAGNTIYWVRNPGDATYNIMCVNSDGSINDKGAPESRTDICMRPALWVRYGNNKFPISDRLKNVVNGEVELKKEK